jgi:hypothetical protein
MSPRVLVIRGVCGTVGDAPIKEAIVRIDVEGAIVDVEYPQR